MAISFYIAQYAGALAEFLLIEPFKINLTIIAAFLTIIGYSINDKIVVFDRIREVRGKSPLVTPAMVNLSVNQTLSRTLLTGTTTILVLLILYIAGGDAIHGFAFALLVGVLVGTFTSIYIGAPVLLWLMKPAKTGKSPNDSRPAKALPQGTR
jgi:SecD/SecF fusion protein